MARTDAVACGACGAKLPPPARTGRPRRYCDARCRDRAKYERRVAEAPPVWDAAGAEMVVGPDPLTRRAETYAAVERLLAGAAPAAPEDQVAEGLLALRQLGWSFRRLGAEVAPALRWRCTRTADAVRDVLRTAWEGVDG